MNYKFEDCGGVLTSSEGMITSPGFPNSLSGAKSCAWLIQVTPGSTVHIYSLNAVFQSSDNCTDDYLTIQNGGLHDSPVLRRFCASQIASPFTSGNNEVRILMSTGATSDGNGFRLRYRTDSSGCGGVYSGERGLLRSPSDITSPDSLNYPIDTECRWEIILNTGYIVNITFLPPFDIASDSSDCTNGDVLELKDILSDGREVLMNRFCGNSAPSPQVSKTNKMAVIFRSDAPPVGHGFNISWEAVCGGDFTAPTGDIYSPNYPSVYPNYTQCNYTISPGPSRVITLSVVDFELEGGSSCRYDSLQISSQNMRRRTFCGTSRPREIVSQTELAIGFKTDGSIR